MDLNLKKVEWNIIVSNEHFLYCYTYNVCIVTYFKCVSLNIFFNFCSYIKYYLQLLPFSSFTHKVLHRLYLTFRKFKQNLHSKFPFTFKGFVTFGLIFSCSILLCFPVSNEKYSHVKSLNTWNRDLTYLNSGLSLMALHLNVSPVNEDKLVFYFQLMFITLLYISRQIMVTFFF